MTHFPSLPEGAHLSDLFRRFPKGVAPLLRLHDAFLREESEFTVAERELIAAYVSGLNQCSFCFGAHKLMAHAFGIEEGVFDTLMSDPEMKDVAPKMRPVLRFAGKLTSTPSRMTAADAQAVLDAGWGEEALYDAIAICALYNYMNRILDGAGITPGPEYARPAPEMLKRRREGTYTGWGIAEGIVSGPAGKE
jgi:uncharacterized peroxidase-related enzyme